MHRYSPDMYFLVTYRRSRGELLAFELFTSSADQLAALHAAESVNRDADVEVVALWSTSIDSLKVTHGRYFVSAPADLQPVMR